MDKTIKVGRRNVTIHQFTGKVVNTSKQMETQVHGGGGGGYAYQGTGNSAPVSISTSTIIHDQIFIVNKEGKERAIQISDFDVACRQSNIITVMWATIQGYKSGSYFAVINHSTEQKFIKEKIIKDIVGECCGLFREKDRSLGWLILIGLLVACWFVPPLLFLLVGYVIYYNVVVLKSNLKIFSAAIEYPTVDLWLS